MPINVNNVYIRYIFVGVYVMKCAVIDIRGKSRKKLGNFLITLYILNLTDLFFTKFLLWKAPDLFREANSFMKLIINGIEPYFLKIGVFALVLIYWYWRSEKSNLTQMKRSIFVGKVLIGAYAIINIMHLINMIIYLKVS